MSAPPRLPTRQAASTAPDARTAPMRLFNTMSRQVEEFAPADGRTVRLYTCGPTVYNPAHLGNFRTFLFEDLLRRVITLRGWGIRQVMNLTDVDDRIIQRAAERGLTIAEMTAPVIEAFHRDRGYLRIQSAEVYPRATEAIPAMIELVSRLMQRGLAYQADDGSVYFAIGKFPGYGRLSRLDTREIKVGARVAQDEYSKENAQDFALWKRAKDVDEKVGAAWDSPWGRGRPGWHLECSAMAMAELGEETLDIHCGAVDLIFPHHEDEIAQSEGATGTPFVRIWCHGEHLKVDDTKMSKRLGNDQTVQALRERGVPGPAYRHLVFSTHYRKQLNLTADALDASIEAVRRIADFAERLQAAKGGTPELARVAEELESDGIGALYEDLNAPQTVAALFTFIRKANAELDRSGSDGAALERARAAFGLIDGVLDLVPVRAAGSDLAAWVEERLAARKAARSARDFARADSIRKEIEDRGVAIEDSPQGTRWKVR